MTQSTYRAAAAHPTAHTQSIPAAHIPQQRATHQTAAQRAARKKDGAWKRIWLPVLVGVLALLIGIGGTVTWSAVTNNAGAYIDTDKYQAVFFTNGQVYFGKLKILKHNQLQLSEVYYLQTQASETGDSENPQAATADQSNIQLIKLGDEVHGPEDAMIISRDQVLFYENLKSDGKVVQSIDKFKSTNQ